MTDVVKKIRAIYRSAITGRFVKKAFALLHPKETTKEKVK